MNNRCITIVLLLMALVTGCNSDIFIDGLDFPDGLSATVEGDGGEASFTIPVKDLEHLTLDVYSELQEYCTYYNADGEIIDFKSPASDVYRIVYENDFYKMEIYKQGTVLTIRNISCTSSRADHWTIRLEYSYGVRFINVTVLPGQPIKLLKIDYPEEIKIKPIAKTVVSRVRIDNISNSTIVYETYPYLNVFASILVEATRPYSWVNGERFTMSVPVYDAGEWGFGDKSIVPGNRYTYEGPDRMIKKDVTIPASQDVYVITEVTYTEAETTGKMYFINEVLDRRFSEDFKVTSNYPIGYDIRIEDAK